MLTRALACTMLLLTEVVRVWFGMRGDGRCGKDFQSDWFGETRCGKGQCCSSHGWCGNGDAFCSVSLGCQSDCWPATHTDGATPDAGQPPGSQMPDDDEYMDRLHHYGYDDDHGDDYHHRRYGRYRGYPHDPDAYGHHRYYHHDADDHHAYGDDHADPAHDEEHDEHKDEHLDGNEGGGGGDGEREREKLDYEDHHPRHGDHNDEDGEPAHAGEAAAATP